MRSRRDVLRLGAAAALAMVPATGAMAAPEGARTLAFECLHTGKRASAVYWKRGAYQPDALSAFNAVLADFRTGETHPIDPRLFDLLSRLDAAIGGGRTFEVISGYRSPTTNAKLASASGGVARKSLHMQGKAIDIRVSSVELPALRDHAIALQGGGVGYYPASNFVHVDIGRVRRWG